ncbi:MAG TPA: SAM-dependent chlorinase/fluorinase [Gemmatimonadaceae bacterium]|nr:SAM-dependent chlorinase/fluorinase [Gemmatimonadaceae bacterium]
MPAVITLLTDFGTADGYVGEMKGVLVSQAPDATLVDISHEVPAHDVELARLTLARYWRRYPPGTVHLIVVDPGVGSERGALAVASDGRYLVGPDNGVLSPALVTRYARAVKLPIPPNASATFHGRDVFAPAAARLASGMALDALGAASSNPIIRRTPEPRRASDGSLHGEVIAVDRFGNAITNLAGVAGTRVSFHEHDFPLGRTYSELSPGQAGAVVGSSGFVEIVVREGRASETLQLARGMPVILR